MLLHFFLRDSGIRIAPIQVCTHLLSSCARVLLNVERIKVRVDVLQGFCLANLSVTIFINTSEQLLQSQTPRLVLMLRTSCFATEKVEIKKAGS